MKIIPQGKKILALPIETKEGLSMGGVIIPESVAVANLSKAKVVEVSHELSHKYKPDDIVLYPSKSGLGQNYNGVLHLWLIEREFDSDIWGVITEDKKGL